MENIKMPEVTSFELNGKSYDFNKVDSLPTGGSQYTYTSQSGNVYIRGLRTGEAKALARIATSDEDPSISELMSVYGGAIYGLDPWTLSEIDFSALITYINIYTQSKAGWNVKANCPQEGCDGVHNTFITLFDLEFSEPKYESLPIEFVTANGDVLKLNLPSILKISEYEVIRDNEAIEKEYDTDILSYAPEIYSINDKTVEIMEAYEYLFDMEPLDFEEIVKIDDKLLIEVLPQKFTCPKCKEPFLFEFSLNHQKAFALPRL